jgi:hypothetical protein
MPFILTIREQGSSWAGRDPVSSIHPTERDAHAALVDYVRDNWDSEIDEIERPADEDELIQQYFACVP